jgi:hypothetical protein
MDQWLEVGGRVGVSSVKEDIPVRRHEPLLIPLQAFSSYQSAAISQ